jgi:hypothetical protein
MIREKGSTAAGDYWREIGPVSQPFIGSQAFTSKGAACRLLAASQARRLAVHNCLELTACRQDSVRRRHFRSYRRRPSAPRTHHLRLSLRETYSSRQER